MSSLVGTKLDKYLIHSEVGHGGMSAVYRGTDTVLHREVAVKVLHPHLASREESRRRFQREALVVAKLHHENILEIFDYSGDTDKESYIITEFIHGMTLHHWLETRWRPRPALAALIVHRLCLALAHAHHLGIVHRDIKPENVMIRNDGCIKLMDFGIAQIIDHQKLTMTGQLMGSPAYMAPELILGEPVDARTDLFAVGVMLYQMATGSLPFPGRNPHEVLTKIVDTDYVAPVQVCSLVDDELTAIIDEALARDPIQRFQTAEGLAAELATYLKNVGINVEQEPIANYFKDPEKYVADLDDCVCSALVERAEQAHRSGQSARAIHLLSRVLEIEDDQKQARVLLQRLQSQERKTRRIMFAGAFVVGTGLVSTAMALLLLAPPKALDLPGTELQKPFSVTPQVSYTHQPEAPIETPAIIGETVFTTTEEILDSTSDAPTSPATPAVTPPLIKKRSSCTIALKGIPLNVAKHHQLMVGDQRLEISSLTVPIQFSSDEVTLEIVGKDPRYWGKKLIQKQDCTPELPLAFQVYRKPAQLRFSDLPPNATVTCVSGPPSASPCKDHRPHLASSFPTIFLDDDYADIKLHFTCANYQPLTKTVTINPGRNQIAVQLTPRD